MDAVASVGMASSYTSIAKFGVAAANAVAMEQTAAMQTVGSPSSRAAIAVQSSSLIQSPEAVSNSDMVNALLLLAAMKLFETDDKKKDDSKLLAGLLVLAAASRLQNGGVLSFQSQTSSMTVGSGYLEIGIGQASQASAGYAAYAARASVGAVAAVPGIDISA